MGKPVTSSLNLTVNTYTFGKFGKGPSRNWWTNCKSRWTFETCQAVRNGLKVFVGGLPERTPEPGCLTLFLGWGTCGEHGANEGLEVGEATYNKSCWVFVPWGELLLVASCYWLQLRSFHFFPHSHTASCRGMLWANTFQSALWFSVEAGLEGDTCTMVLLMAELLHHFGCISPSKLDRGAHSQLVARFHPTW